MPADRSTADHGVNRTHRSSFTQERKTPAAIRPLLFSSYGHVAVCGGSLASRGKENRRVTFGPDFRIPNRK
jgi:hypothetical protein